MGHNRAVTPPPAPGSSQIAQAIEAADLRVAVLCLFHLTGDRRWLEPPYRPRRDVSLVPDPAAGFDDDTAQEIRATLADLVTSSSPPVVDNPNPALFGEMMSVCLGESVSDEYIPMMRADLGFHDASVHWTDHAARRDLHVIIIGAGVSGLCLANDLDRLHIDYTIVEKNADVGGTWFENRYPGCGVDTPNHFYSFSFAPNPGWTHYFSPRDELQAYLEDFADRAGLRKRVRYDTTVVGASWSEATNRWTARLEAGDGTTSSIEGDVLVSATGHFNQPLAARFEGDDTFTGQIFHTAAWPDDADLSGKRVAIIGTGASAMQVVPTIAGDVAQLTVFQRTPQWVRHVPEYNAHVDPAAQLLFEAVPFYARWYRFSQFWRYGDGLLRFLRRDPDWSHPDRAMNKTNDRHRVEMTEFITEALAERPELIDHCVPTYPPFGKRILIDNGWFATLCRPHVRLETASIDRFEPAGIRTADGDLHECDVIVLATGFVVTDLAARMDIVGRGGVRLADDWADENPSAHLGMTVPGFPNFFVMYGPNTNMGHGGSGMWLAETQTRYISGCLRALAEHELPTVEVRDDVRQAYTAEIDRRHAELIWTHPGTTTYYRNRAGKVRSPMPFRLVDYWHMTREPVLADFVEAGGAQTEGP